MPIVQIQALPLRSGPPVSEVARGLCHAIADRCGCALEHVSVTCQTLEPGAYADLLVIDGNPVKELELLRDRDNLQLIMQDGKIWKNTLVPPAHPQHIPVEGSHSPTPSL